MSLTPESMHLLTLLFSPRGIPKDHRHMDGFGVNTYRMVIQDRIVGLFAQCDAGYGARVAVGLGIPSLTAAATV